MTAWHAPAKINLALHVTGLMDNGYHRLETLAAFTALGDRINVLEAAVDGFGVSGRFAESAPLDGSNLVLKARDLLRREFGRRRCPPVFIQLEKALPVASGIGGGSSDAAAALKALSAHWGLDLASESLAALGAGLGADVPMCVIAEPLLARGTGSEMTRLGGFPEIPVLLINPGIAVATPEVFKALTQKSNPGLEPLPQFSGPKETAHWLARQRNDLQPPAMSLAPVIADVIAALEGQGALVSRMSGSGATCYGLFGNADAASRAAQAIAAAQPGWFAEATHLMQSGALS